MNFPLTLLSIAELLHRSKVCKFYDKGFDWFCFSQRPKLPFSRLGGELLSSLEQMRELCEHLLRVRGSCGKESSTNQQHHPLLFVLNKQVFKHRQPVSPPCETWPGQSDRLLRLCLVTGQKFSTRQTLPTVFSLTQRWTLTLSSVWEQQTNKQTTKINT